MKKKRLITVITLLVAMVALTGLATAEETTITTVLDPAGTEFFAADGSQIMSTTAVGPAGMTVNVNGNTHTVVVTAPGGVTSFKIKGISNTINGVFSNTLYNVGNYLSVTINGVPVIPDGTNTITADVVPSLSPQTFIITYTNDKGANIGDSFYIGYFATYMGGSPPSETTMSNKLTLTVQSSWASIPEFPTVALPVAAAIGLVFFFQHRKKKEE
jgi:hypothetical protein